jgi:hypothetical protein
MPGIAPARFHAQLAGRQIKLVMEDNYVGQVDLVKPRGLGHGASGFVHIGLGLKQQHARGSDGAFARQTLKSFPQRGEIEFARNGVDRHEADVVPVVRIFRAGVSQSDKERHSGLLKLR